MEWVETTAKSVEEAKELALDKLGVDEIETEFDVLEEPKQGLFGRVRGEARVRARVTPKTPRAKEERRDRSRRPKKKAEAKDDGIANAVSGTGEGEKPERGDRQNGGGGSQGGSSSNSSNGSRDRNRDGRARKKQADRPRPEDAPMEDVIASVEGFLTGLTAAFGVDAPVTLVTDDESITAQIEGKHGLLLGPKARTLDAIQELTRVTAQRTSPSSIRIKVDVGGYREARSEALVSFAREAAQRAVHEADDVVLEPMSSADRKIIHDALTDVEGVSTRSAGNDPRRRVIIVPDPESGTGASEEDDGDDGDS
jgi:spoIIIJ-associated protein